MLSHLLGFKFKAALRCCAPFGKHECLVIPMGLCNSPDIFQEKMSKLMDRLEFVLTYIDDLMCFVKGSFSDNVKS